MSLKRTADNNNDNMPSEKKHKSSDDDTCFICEIEIEKDTGYQHCLYAQPTHKKCLAKWMRNAAAQGNPNAEKCLQCFKPYTKDDLSNIFSTPNSNAPNSNAPNSNAHINVENEHHLQSEISYRLQLMNPNNTRAILNEINYIVQSYLHDLTSDIKYRIVQNSLSRFERFLDSFLYQKQFNLLFSVGDTGTNVVSYTDYDGNQKIHTYNNILLHRPDDSLSTILKTHCIRPNDVLRIEYENKVFNKKRPIAIVYDYLMVIFKNILWNQSVDENIHLFDRIFNSNAYEITIYLDPFSEPYVSPSSNNTCSLMGGKKNKLTKRRKHRRKQSRRHK